MLASDSAPVVRDHYNQLTDSQGEREGDEEEGGRSRLFVLSRRFAISVITIAPCVF